MLPFCLLFPIKFLLKGIYGLEEDDIWSIPRWLFSAWQSLICKWDASPCCMKPSIKFLLKRIYGLVEDVGWRIPRWLFSARQSLICKWDDFSFFWVSNKFLLKGIYGLEEVVWKTPKRLFSAWPSFVSKWNVGSIYESFFGLKHPIKFLLMRTYGLEFSTWPSYVSEWNESLPSLFLAWRIQAIFLL